MAILFPFLTHFQWENVPLCVLQCYACFNEKCEMGKASSVPNSSKVVKASVSGALCEPLLASHQILLQLYFLRLSLFPTSQINEMLKCFPLYESKSLPTFSAGQNTTTQSSALTHF